MKSKQDIVHRIVTYAWLPLLLGVILFLIGYFKDGSAENKADLIFGALMGLGVELIGAVIIFVIIWVFYERTKDEDNFAGNVGTTPAQQGTTHPSAQPLNAPWKTSLIEALTILIDNGDLSSTQLNVFRSPLGKDGVELLSREEVNRLQRRIKST